MVGSKFILLFAATIIFAMLINVFHPFLWGPDEPRVAEIAREAYIGGNYITPHLCGLPFVEKPPLYFDLVAWCYALNGGAEPGIGRLVSALLGCIMLAACFWAAYRWGGLRRAVFASMLLITMPQFYRAAHWIITDIGVGAFCSLALCLFLYYEFWQGKIQNTSHGHWLCFTLPLPEPF
jgi:4-amino-4-deoxy-L-arabinose transferase-like glycosyltransferase